MCFMQKTLGGMDRTRRVSSAGFTRVEVVAVCVILFVFMVMMRPRLSDHGPSRIIATQADLARMRTALDQFRADTGRFPHGTNALLELVLQPLAATNWHGPYLEKIPIDPWSHKYIYENPGKHASSGHPYDLYSPGPDGPEGVIGNWQ
jgi:general secretion pathway protein G